MVFQECMFRVADNSGYKVRFMCVLDTHGSVSAGIQVRVPSACVWSRDKCEGLQVLKLIKTLKGSYRRSAKIGDLIVTSVCGAPCFVCSKS